MLTCWVCWPSGFTPADGSTRWALKFGAQKINLHPAGAEFEPKAQRPTPGSADLCFLSDTALADWQADLAAQGVDIEQGPIVRPGRQGRSCQSISAIPMTI